MELNKIYNIDAFDGLKQLGDKSVDLILTDPPYGIGETNQKNASRKKLAKPTDFSSYQWDEQRLPGSYFREMLRISKEQVIFGGNYYTDYLNPSSCWIVWDKDNGDNDFADCELAWTSFKGAVRKFKWRWAGMLQEKMNWKEKRVHPTQKPLELFRWILKKYTKEGDLVLDPFMGSGTTAVACKQLNRRFIGFETDKNYVDVANKRLSQNTLLGVLQI